MDELMNESYSIAKKTKNWNFECQNCLKVAQLYLNQPEKLDDLLKIFMATFARSLHEDEKFLLLCVLGELYEKGGMVRKKNLYYYLASLIHLSKKPELSAVLLVQIQKEAKVREFPFLYRQILQMIIAATDQGETSIEYYLELLSKCGNDLSQKEVESTLAELNFSNYPVLQLEHIDFITLKEFAVVDSDVKPKQNRIGQRRDPIKIGPGFFMSWKKDDNLLFE